MNKSMLPSGTTTKTQFHNQVIYTPQAYFFSIVYSSRWLTKHCLYWVST